MDKWDQLAEQERQKYLDLDKTEDKRRILERLRENMEKYDAYSQDLAMRFMQDGDYTSRYANIFEATYELDRQYNHATLSELDYSIQNFRKKENQLADEITQINIAKRKAYLEEENKKHEH